MDGPIARPEHMVNVPSTRSTGGPRNQLPDSRITKINFPTGLREDCDNYLQKVSRI